MPPSEPHPESSEPRTAARPTADPAPDGGTDADASLAADPGAGDADGDGGDQPTVGANAPNIPPASKVDFGVVLPSGTSDESGVGWGDWREEQDDDDRFLRDVPPHHGTY
jgi:hypothetical protein